MPVIKITTINILNDLSRWMERRSLLAHGLAELKPDLIALQEVRLPSNPAIWLAERLDFPHIYISHKMGFERSKEAIAILSRLPFEDQATLDLHGQQRVAQYVRVNLNGNPLVVANAHLYWQPGESQIRLRQVERLLDWLKALPDEPPCVVCGDFNSTPEAATVQRMRAGWDQQGLTSAYAAIHGSEPEYTCPTPLPRSRKAQLRTFLGFFLLIRPKHLDSNWRGTLDYIFVSQHIQIEDCQVVLNRPAPDNPKIYPSDHFGLSAILKIGA